MLIFEIFRDRSIYSSWKDFTKLQPTYRHWQHSLISQQNSIDDVLIGVDNWMSADVVRHLWSTRRESTTLALIRVTWWTSLAQQWAPLFTCPSMNHVLIA